MQLLMMTDTFKLLRLWLSETPESVSLGVLQHEGKTSRSGGWELGYKEDGEGVITKQLAACVLMTDLGQTTARICRHNITTHTWKHL